MITFQDSSESGESFIELLQQARLGNQESLGELLTNYLNYLTILATTQLDNRLRRRMNPSDLVQEALLAAHRDFRAFRGNSQGELLGWLRQILIHTLHRAVENHLRAEKRDVRREVSIEQISTNLEHSATNLANMLPSPIESPSAALHAKERVVLLANQLAKLSPQYRDVIVYRILQGLSFEEIAERMERTAGATRMLLLRALEQFKVTHELAHDD